MFLTSVLIGVLYQFMPIETMTNLVENFPEVEVIFAAIGGGDFGTPEGFFQLEIFGLTAPAALMVVGISIGARVLSGEESRHTMGLLLANPIPRFKIIIEKSLTMAICAFIVGFATFAGIWLGSLLGGLDMNMGNIAATCLLVTLLGLVFGTLALALSAATGNGRVAVFGSIGVALVSYMLSSFLPLSESISGYARWSPYHYYLSSDPIVMGMNWGHGAILAGITFGLVFLSAFLFQRRDLR